MGILYRSALFNMAASVAVKRSLNKTMMASKIKSPWLLKYVQSEHESVPDPRTLNQRKGLEGFGSGYAVTMEVHSTTSVAAAFSSASQIPRKALMRVDLPVPEIPTIARWNFPS